MVIAGPCSINEQNKTELEEIINQYANGIRVVGLKSRTNLSNKTQDMGIDYPTYIENRNIFLKDGHTKNLEIYPSIEIANNIVSKYPNIIIATEIIDPHLQLPVWEKNFKGKLFIWNPSINQSGHNISIMSQYLKRNKDWYMGIKNGKWIGNTGLSTWLGLTTYLDREIKERVYLIHRGFDIKRNLFNNKYRNVPNHKIAQRIKEKTGLKLLFDPSHTMGPKLKNNIVKESKRALESTLYDGLLIEVGESYTDRDQHISIEEFKLLTKQS